MSKPVVAITRPYDRAKKACEIVKELGGEPVLAPTLDLQPVNTKSLKELVKKQDELDWIVFTSPTTIVSLNEFHPEFLKTLDCKIAVIGNKTGKVANEYGLTVDLVPDNFTAEGLVEEFKKQNIKNQVVGVPRTLSARPTLVDGLKELDNEVIVAEAYRSLFPMDKIKVERLIEQIKNNEIDAITFTSPLTVENFFKIVVEEEKISNLLSEEVITVAIGPITGKVLEEHDISYIYPDTYTVRDMLELLFKVYNGEQNG
ncbi:MAG: uroporphyrinogen-III synthase [Methanobrevibacter sp.]|uniref:uroporphyrinogen-III synthase n=1 Tax=Methanobrevibacter sp. TaxID=66852 RepID=UPI0026E00DDE|nr:uroporphyrinogen-III synthase [Methanobrevibacter sp.]MDO5848697.1 uroporphyrinogen-III synthase [Methanobrevibacter sp.]